MVGQPPQDIGKLVRGVVISDSRDDLDLPPLTPEEEAYEKACDAIIDARLVSKFGPKSKFTDEEILTAVDELEAEDAFPDPPN